MAEAAFELAIERGLGGFSVTDVVNRAGYSRRTFANHFSCKEEAVLSVWFKKVISATENILTNIPADTTMLDAIQGMIKSHLNSQTTSKIRGLMLLVMQNPSLMPHIISGFLHVQLVVKEKISNITDERYSKDYIYLLFGAVSGVLTRILDGSYVVIMPGESEEDASPGSVTLEQLLDKLFYYLRNGF